MINWSVNSGKSPLQPTEKGIGVPGPPCKQITTGMLLAQLAGQGATILLAGKGHETYQIIGKEKKHFDEKEIVSEIFKTL